MWLRNKYGGWFEIPDNEYTPNEKLKNQQLAKSKEEAEKLNKNEQKKNTITIAGKDYTVWPKKETAEEYKERWLRKSNSFIWDGKDDGLPQVSQKAAELILQINKSKKFSAYDKLYDKVINGWIDGKFDAHDYEILLMTLKLRKNDKNLIPLKK